MNKWRRRKILRTHLRSSPQLLKTLYQLLPEVLQTTKLPLTTFPCPRLRSTARSKARRCRGLLSMSVRCSRTDKRNYSQRSGNSAEESPWVGWRRRERQARRAEKKLCKRKQEEHNRRHLQRSRKTNMTRRSQNSREPALRRKCS